MSRVALRMLCQAGLDIMINPKDLESGWFTMENVFWWATKSDTKSNILKYNYSSFTVYVCVQTLECNVLFHCPGSHLDYRVLFDSKVFLFFPGPTACDTKASQSDSQAISLLKRYSH